MADHIENIVFQTVGADNVNIQLQKIGKSGKQVGTDVAEGFNQATPTIANNTKEITKSKSAYLEHRSVIREQNFYFRELSHAMGAVALATTFLDNGLGGQGETMKKTTNAVKEGLVAYQGLSFALMAVPGGQIIASVVGIGIALKEFANFSTKATQEAAKFYAQLNKDTNDKTIQQNITILTDKITNLRTLAGERLENKTFGIEIPILSAASVYLSNMVNDYANLNSEQRQSLGLYQDMIKSIKEAKEQDVLITEVIKEHNKQVLGNTEEYSKSLDKVKDIKQKLKEATDELEKFQSRKNEFENDNTLYHSQELKLSKVVTTLKNALEDAKQTASVIFSGTGDDLDKIKVKLESWKKIQEKPSELFNLGPSLGMSEKQLHYWTDRTTSSIRNFASETVKSLTAELNAATRPTSDIDASVKVWKDKTKKISQGIKDQLKTEMATNPVEFAEIKLTSATSDTEKEREDTKKSLEDRKATNKEITAMNETMDASLLSAKSDFYNALNKIIEENSKKEEELYKNSDKIILEAKRSFDSESINMDRKLSNELARAEEQSKLADADTEEQKMRVNLEFRKKELDNSRDADIQRLEDKAAADEQELAQNYDKNTALLVDDARAAAEEAALRAGKTLPQAKQAGKDAAKAVKNERGEGITSPDVMAREKQMWDSLATLWAKYNKEKENISKMTTDEILAYEKKQTKELLLSLPDKLVGVMNTFYENSISSIESENTAYHDSIKEQTDAIDYKMSHEKLSAITTSRLADEKQALLDKGTKAQAEATKKENEIKTNQAIAQKLANVAQATENAYLAYTKTLAEVGWGFGLGQIAAEANFALAIAAVGAIAAQPIPTFKEGTRPGGFIVPPGFSNDNFMIGVSSGEKVDVKTAGQQSDGRGEQQTIVQNFTFGHGWDENSVKNSIKNIMRKQGVRDINQAIRNNSNIVQIG